jgi:hypothetical protein
MPQPMHFSAIMEAFLPPEKSVVCFTFGSKTKCRSAASTSQSANIAFLASAANDATMLVLPVPPFPLMTTNSFTIFPHLFYQNATKLLPC